MGVFTQVASNIKAFARKFACKSAYASCVNGALGRFVKPVALAGLWDVAFPDVLWYCTCSAVVVEFTCADVPLWCAVELVTVPLWCTVELVADAPVAATNPSTKMMKFIFFFPSFFLLFFLSFFCVPAVRSSVCARATPEQYLKEGIVYICCSKLLIIWIKFASQSSVFFNNRRLQSGELLFRIMVSFALLQIKHDVFFWSIDFTDLANFENVLTDAMQWCTQVTRTGIQVPPAWFEKSNTK